VRVNRGRRRSFGTSGRAADHRTSLDMVVPVLAVAAAAVMFLHAVLIGGSDIALDLLCTSADAA
jgi:hypothetical protein